MEESTGCTEREIENRDSNNGVRRQRKRRLTCLPSGGSLRPAKSPSGRAECTRLLGTEVESLREPRPGQGRERCRPEDSRWYNAGIHAEGKSVNAWSGHAYEKEKQL